MIQLFRCNFAKIFILVVIFLNFPNAYAINEQFQLDLDLKYDVKDDGVVEVTKKIGIINLENELSVTSFTQNLEEYNYYDLEAIDSMGNVEFKEIDEDTTKRIVVPLRGAKIGRNQVNNLTIKYKSKELLKKVGSIYYLNLPKIPRNNIKNLNVTIIVPKALGNLIFISPNNSLKEESEKYVTYKFVNNASLDQGISANFGEFQLINFDIKYQLKNTSNWFQNQEIALIPDIAKRQEISIKELNPKPIEIYTDQDGNYLAKYRINPGSNLEISFKGSVRVYGPVIDINSGGYFENIPEKIKSNYTKEQTYWETKAPEITDISSTLFEKEKSVVFNANKIYKFLTENYKYNFEITKNNLVERNGALKALKREVPLGCMEFSDSFIAIARSMGIPAREINGYAFSKDPDKNPININLSSGDVLHSWVEFYDPNLGWIQIDPTWGTTSGIDYFSKLDLNHITFVTKGIDSEYPLPAGMYRLNEENKLIQFDFPNNPDVRDFDIKYEASRDFSFNFLNLLTNKEPIKVNNTGSTTIFNVGDEKILPFESKVVYISKYEEKTYKNFNENKFELKLNNSVFYYILIIVYISFVGLLLYAILYFVVTRAKYLQKLLPHLFRHPRGRGQ
jgi:transglutaminase-like putative cysteine protease